MEITILQKKWYFWKLILSIVEMHTAILFPFIFLLVPQTKLQLQKDLI